ncbi:MAG: phage/plasmid primase, P4 family [Gammaproteobacteria bacterium]|nr:phage/plasmid primase, P4 family [Gammaproteobacteria bacterium]
MAPVTNTTLKKLQTELLAIPISDTEASDKFFNKVRRLKDEGKIKPSEFHQLQELSDTCTNPPDTSLPKQRQNGKSKTKLTPGVFEDLPPLNYGELADAVWDKLQDRLRYVLPSDHFALLDPTDCLWEIDKTTAVGELRNYINAVGEQMLANRLKELKETGASEKTIQRVMWQWRQARTTSEGLALMADKHRVPPTRCNLSQFNDHTGIIALPKQQNVVVTDTSITRRKRMPTDMLTKAFPHEPNYNDTPELNQYLEHLLKGDVESMEYLLDWIAYALTRDTGARRLLLVLEGRSNSGKSTLLDVVRKLFGASMCAEFTQKDFAKDGNRHSSWLVPAHGVPLILIDETDRWFYWDHPELRKLTSGGHITCNKMRENPFTFQAQCKTLIATNHAPRNTSKESGIFNRAVFIKADNVLPKEKIDCELPERIEAEIPALLGRLEKRLEMGMSKMRVRINAPPKVLIENTRQIAEEGDDTYNKLQDAVLELGSDHFKDTEGRIPARRVYELLKERKEYNRSKIAFGRDAREALPQIDTKDRASFPDIGSDWYFKTEWFE